MKKYLFFPLAVMALFMVSCSDNDSPDPNDGEDEVVALGTAKKVVLSAPQIEINQAQGKFAIDLIHEFNSANSGEDRQYNCAVSPFGAFQMLSLVANSLAGESQANILEILKHSDIDELNDFNAYLMEELPNVDPKWVSFTQAFAAWLNTEYNVKNVDKFESILSQYYNAPVYCKSFLDYNVKTEYNDWVASVLGVEQNSNQDTDGDLYGRDVPSYMVNAFVFDGKWNKKFGSVSMESFYDEDGHQLRSVSTMKGSQEVGYASIGNSNLYTLYYGNGGYCLRILLPNEGAKLDDEIAAITYDSWQEAKNTIRSKSIYVEMPRLELKINQPMLSESLVNMGMHRGFVESDLFDEYFVTLGQRGELSINETGTVVKVTSSEIWTILPGDQPDEVYVNRPYALFLEEESTGAILAFAKIYDPSAVDEDL